MKRSRVRHGELDISGTKTPLETQPHLPSTPECARRPFSPILFATSGGTWRALARTAAAARGRANGRTACLFQVPYTFLAFCMMVMIAASSSVAQHKLIA